jgi:hypothetical protein
MHTSIRTIAMSFLSRCSSASRPELAFDQGLPQRGEDRLVAHELAGLVVDQEDVHRIFATAELFSHR